MLDQTKSNNTVKVNLRDHGDDLGTYLAARSKAGCTAADILAGVETLSGGAVVGRFFALGPARSLV